MEERWKQETKSKCRCCVRRCRTIVTNWFSEMERQVPGTGSSITERGHRRAASQEHKMEANSTARARSPPLHFPTSGNHTLSDPSAMGSRNSKTLAPWKENCDKPGQCIQKQRHHSANKDPSSQSHGFSSSHIWV